ncbi:cyclin-dependent kinase 12-like isoform X1 [Clarias magur]|uniref:Cyclin-dependent kinase 12-like isoform X1 n=1 Tax=Clarias magur TaxID=1594786 RepID=A0A8J4TXU6_CLAMG|nr:cyclin-dependent kinase 12-like isoform X1 [Clarias magur]
MLNCSPALISSTPGTPAAYAGHLALRLSHAFKDAALTTATSKQHQKTQYDKKLVFHPHQPGDLVLLDNPAQKMQKLAPRWKGPFVVQRRMSRDGHPGVTYEITDPRDARLKSWVVHHNRLKPYKGVLPAVPIIRHASPVSSRAGISVASAPCLTALSGALPFRPPTPPYVPATAGQRGLTIPASTVPQGSSNPNINPTDPGSSSPSSPVTNSSSGGRASLSHGPVQVISRAGRQVRRPLKYRDFVL